MRKLACAALSYTCAVIAAHYILPSGALLWGALGFGVLFLLSLLLKGTARLRCALICLFAALGLTWYWGYDALFIQPGQALAGETVTVSARVTDYPCVYEDYTSLSLRFTGDDLPHVKATVYDYDGRTDSLLPGDVVEIELRLRSGTVRYGEDSDANTSRGIALVGYVQSAPEVTGRAALSFLYFPRTLARIVRETASQIFDGDVSALMRGMLIGDKSGIYDDDALYAALSGAGLLHIVAVSGMHLSFLFGAAVLLGGKRRAAFIAIPALWIFACMAGLTPSAVRAAFMLTLVVFAPLLRREPDGVTSLCAILLLLLLINPQAIGSASLQLSFAAMAGIILVSPKVNSWCVKSFAADKKSRLHKVKLAVFALLASSIGAMVFTAPLSALRFGYVPLVSPLTMLLVMPVLSLCFIGGYISVLLGIIWLPLGKLAGWAVWVLAKYIIVISKAISSLPLASVYMADKLVGWWLVAVYVAFIATYLLRGKNSFRPAAPLSVSVILLSCIVIFNALYYNNISAVSVIDVGQGQSIALMSDGYTAMIDCGGTNTSENAGDAAADYLASCGRRNVDVLILTHLHSDHANGVTRLLARVDVGYILLPENAEDPAGLLPEIIEAAGDSGTQIEYVSADTDVLAGSMRLRLYGPPKSGDINERGLIVLATCGSYDTLVTGDVDAASERNLLAGHTLPDCELYIVGHHGSRYSTSVDLLETIDAETAAISVGYNTYGHPTEDVLERLESEDMEILRTDTDGTVTVRMR